MFVPGMLNSVCPYAKVCKVEWILTSVLTAFVLGGHPPSESLSLLLDLGF